ncbi:MAG: putative Ig domain-containing protein [Opitutae bacterium]|nr:putative Ig domain-containing protein [Opitutae bacterium]
MKLPTRILALLFWLGLTSRALAAAAGFTSGSISLSSTTPALNSTAGQIVFNVTFSWAGAPSSVGVQFDLPAAAGWSFASSTSPAFLDVKPSAGATGSLGWAAISQTPPADGTATFAVTINYPAGLTTKQVLANAMFIVNDAGGNPVSTPTTPEVMKIAQTITFPALGNITYGDAAPSLSATATSGLTVAYSVASGPATVSGSTLTITGAGTVTVQAGQAGNTDYAAAAATSKSFTVAQKALTLTGVTVASKTYDGTTSATFASTGSLSGVLAGDAGNVTLNTSGATAAFNSANRGTSVPVTVSGFALAGTAASKYSLTQPSGITGTINPAVLTTKADDKSRAYGAADPAFTATITGFVGAETVASATSGSLDFSTTATASSPVGTYPIDVLSGTFSAPNYNFNTQSGTLTISPAGAQTVTFPAMADTTYGAAPITLNATASSGLAVSYSVVSGPATVAGGTLTITGAGNITVRASQPGDANYPAATPVDRTFAVGKAPLTVKANNAGRAVGQPDPAFTATYSGFVNGDTAAVVSGTPAFSTTATASSPTGAYPLNVALGSLSAANYSFATFTAGTYTIVSQAQTMSFSISGAAAVGSPVTMTAVPSSGLPAAYSLVSGNASISGSSLTLNDSNAVTVRATQAGDANYAPVTADLTVKAGQSGVTVALGGLAPVYAGTPRLATVTTTPAGQTATITYDGGATAPTNAGTYAVFASVNNANYVGVGTGTMVIAKAPLTVQADNKNRQEGQLNPSLTVSYSGFVNGETASALTAAPTATTTATSSSAAGAYPITVSGGSATNYSFTYQSGTLTVKANPVPTITSATVVSATEGAAFSYKITATNSPTSYSATGLPAGLKVDGSTGDISGSPEAAGTFTVTLGATNPSGTGTTTLTLMVSNRPLPVITSPSLAGGTAGMPFRFRITATNSPTSYAASGLPQGLAVESATGIISGTPAGAGDSTVTVSATNASGTGSASLGLSVENRYAVSTLSTILRSDGSSILSFASAVVRDSSGNLYLADTGNHVIRKVAPDWAVSVFAGAAGQKGSTDATGADARFDSPAGLAIDSNGVLYVSDSGNHTIRKISGQGAVTTFAGSAGNSGAADGAGATARFNQPAGLSIDVGGNLYVADTNNHVIRKITSSGTVSTLAGFPGASGLSDGVGVTARFSSPEAVLAMAGSGSSGTVLYVADTGNHTLRKVDAQGSVSTVAGAAGAAGSDDGLGTMARFNQPAGVSADSSGVLYVSDSGNHTLRKVAASGVVTTIAGEAGSAGKADGAGNVARFSGPTDLLMTSEGLLYAMDTGNSTVRLVFSMIAPKITTQPTSRAADVGTRTEFKVVAIGQPEPSYQWHKNGVAISGATSSTFALASVALGDAGDYTVTVKNSLGEVTSNRATLTVNSPPIPSYERRDSGGGSFEGGFVLLMASMFLVRWLAGRRRR